jgi:hypothetical protein
MAYERLTFPPKYVKYREYKTGDIVAEGVYLGPKEKTGDYPGTEYQFKNVEKGLIYHCPDSYNLRDNLNKYTSVGDWIKVVYLSGEIATKGRGKGKPQHRFDLDIDPDRSVRAEPTAPTEDLAPSDAANDLEDETL